MLKAWKGARKTFGVEMEWIIVGPHRNISQTLYRELSEEAKILNYVSERVGGFVL